MAEVPERLKKTSLEEARKRKRERRRSECCQTRDETRHSDERVLGRQPPVLHLTGSKNSKFLGKKNLSFKAI